jgi:hypothetical protein
MKGNNMRIRINNIGEETTKKSAKGFYKVFTLSYNSDGRDRTRDIPNFDKETYATLRNANAGDEFDITLVKNGEYTNWSGAEKAPVSATASNVNSGFKKASTYETAEERAARQVYIIRQSSLDHAVAFVNSQSKGKAAVSEVLDVADTFVNYVLNGRDADFDVHTADSAANSVE